VALLKSRTLFFHWKGVFPLKKNNQWCYPLPANLCILRHASQLYGVSAVLDRYCVAWKNKPIQSSLWSGWFFTSLVRPVFLITVAISIPAV